MAQNIFDATFDSNNRIDVNSFDWSHVNNLTTDFGRVTPVFCELVPAKGSLRINPEFGLELMPMVFPVQTRMFAPTGTVTIGGNSVDTADKWLAGVNYQYTVRLSGTGLSISTISVTDWVDAPNGSDMDIQ